MKHIAVVILALFGLQASAQCTSTATVPYYEGFNAITANNQLPGCWTVSIPSACLTFTAVNGNGYAAFAASPVGAKNFYSGPIALQAGVVYSATAWYRITSPGSNFSSFALRIGPAQAVTGLTTIATTTAAVTNTVFALLANTFTVAAPGVYFLSVEAVSSSTTGSADLLWDDLAVTVPCTIASNQPTLALSPSTGTFCAGDTVAFSASGADTYSWSNGATTPSIATTFSFSTSLFVTGTKTLSGCTATASGVYAIFPKPNPSVIIQNAPACVGTSVTAIAFGGSTYTWSSGAAGSTIKVLVTPTTVVTLTASNGNVCSTVKIVTIASLPAPDINVTPASTTVCEGDQVQLAASGADSYTCVNCGSNGAIAIASVSAGATYSVSGTGSNGCVGVATLTLDVNACTTLSSYAETAPRIYPNPASQQLNIRADNAVVEMRDVSGRVVLTTKVRKSAQIDISELPRGIYLLQIAGSGKKPLIVAIQ